MYQICDIHDAKKRVTSPVFSKLGIFAQPHRHQAKKTKLTKIHKNSSPTME